MLCKDEIRALYGKISFDAVTLGMQHAEKRLEDALKTKDNLEKKAFAILGGYITISVATLGGAFFKIENGSSVFYSLIIIGIIFLLAAMMVLRSLKTPNYGTIGSYPDAWLRGGILDGNRDSTALNIAYILHDYQGAITISDESNEQRLKKLDTAIRLGELAAIVAIALSVLAFIYPLT